MSQWDEPGSDVRQEVLGFHVVRSMSTEVIARLHIVCYSRRFCKKMKLLFSKW